MKTIIQCGFITPGAVLAGVAPAQAQNPARAVRLMGKKPGVIPGPNSV